ncbi:putative reverse transcriptase domain-containing protein, partial [Tanacetum coccineum]
IPTEDPYEEVVRQALEQAPPSLEYVPDPMELEDHVPVYVPEPDYPEYLAPSNDDIPDKEDPADYPADGRDNDDESSVDDDDDDDEEEEEHLAPANSTVVAPPVVDHVPSTKETESFKTDESAATPPPPPAYHTTSRIVAIMRATPSHIPLPTSFLPSPIRPLHTREAMGSKTSISSEARSWSIPTEDPYEEAVRQALEQESPSPEYVPDPIELENHVPVYVPEPDYPEYLASSDDDIPVEYQPLPADASPVALSPGYIADSDLEEDEEDPEETTMMMSHLIPIPFPFEEEVARLLALPTPPPSPLTPLLSPPTSPTYDQAPLGTPPLLPIPLPTPSTSRRADISEADMPLRKRLLLTALTPRFEAGESYAAAASRQPGSTMAHRVNYNVRRRVSLEFYAWHQDAQTDRAAVRAEIEKMAPKRTATTTTTTAVTDAQFKALITRGVADALAEIEANRTSRNGDDSHDSGTSSRRTERAARECNYNDFLKCQALNFKGTEGVVGLTQWFKKMKYVFHISNCTIACQIKFSTYTLQGKALTWWNSHIKTVGHDVAYTMTWKALKKMMIDKYCPRGEIKKLEIELWNLKVKGTDVESYSQRFQYVMASKPKTMQDAIEFATELMDQKIRTLAEHQAENKRKFEDTLRNNQNQQQPFKRHNVARAYTARPGEKKHYGGSKPLYPKCNYHHDGQCTPKCTNCKRTGHSAWDCRSQPATANNNQRAQGKN